MVKLILGNTFLILVIVFTNSNALQLGRCPFVSPQVDVALADLLGSWYEYAKYPIVTESLSKCIRLEIEKLPHDAVSVQRFQTGRFSEAEIGVTGRATLNSPGVLEISPIGLAGIFGNPTVSILGTDNLSYIVAFICEELFGFGILHQQYAFVLSKERHPTQDVINLAEAALRNNGLSVQRLVQTNQQNCLENH